MKAERTFCEKANFLAFGAGAETTTSALLESYSVIDILPHFIRTPEEML